MLSMRSPAFTDGLNRRRRAPLLPAEHSLRQPLPPRRRPRQRMPNESHTTHVDSRERATTLTTSTEPSPRPDLRSMELEAADRSAIQCPLVLTGPGLRMAQPRVVTARLIRRLIRLGIGRRARVSEISLD